MTDRLVGEREERLTRVAKALFEYATWHPPKPGKTWEQATNYEKASWLDEAERILEGEPPVLASSPSPPDREQAVERVAEWIFEWSMEERAVFTKQDYYKRPWAEVDEHTKHGWREKAQHVIALAFGSVRGDES